MFHEMRNTSKHGTSAINGALDQIRRRLPADWALSLSEGHEPPRAQLKGPDGRKATLSLIARKSLTPRDAVSLAWPTDDPPLVVAPFLSERVREILAANGVRYADGTGNVRFVVPSPAVFIEGIGADRNPHRVPRSLHRLRGAAAGRVVRALCEFRTPFGVRALAEAAATPLGTVSRVVSFLEEEALLTRDDGKQVVHVDWPSLLERWTKDYGITTSNRVRTFLEPRGLANLWPKLSRLPRYAATGSVAGPGIAAPRLAMVFVDDAASAAETLGLVPAEAGMNVFLIEPFNEVVFDRTRTLEVAGSATGTTITGASLPQTVADLLTSPGRGPIEAAALMDQMKGTTNDWRRAM